MTEEKMDFRKWQASQKSESGDNTEELVTEFSKEMYLLTFNLDKKGTNIVSQHNGCIVFVDRNFQYEVSVGDTWICELTRANNCAYARPIVKITLNNILNFNEQLRENVLNVLWKKYSNDLKVIFENRYKSELQNKITEDIKTDYIDKLARITKQKDEIENELLQTKIQLESQRDFVPYTNEDFIILGSNDKNSKNDSSEAPASGIKATPSDVIDRYPTRNTTEQQPTLIAQRDIPQIKRVAPVTQKFEVERIGPDSLRSPSFTDTRYFVHISPDYKLLVIRPNEEGNVYCLNKVIRLKDLGLVSGFADKKFLFAEYSELYEGMIVRL